MAGFDPRGLKGPKLSPSLRLFSVYLSLRPWYNPIEIQFKPPPFPAGKAGDLAGRNFEEPSRWPSPMTAPKQSNLPLRRSKNSLEKGRLSGSGREKRCCLSPSSPPAPAALTPLLALGAFLAAALRRSMDLSPRAKPP